MKNPSVAQLKKKKIYLWSQLPLAFIFLKTLLIAYFRISRDFLVRYVIFTVLFIKFAHFYYIFSQFDSLLLFDFTANHLGVCDKCYSN